MLLFVSVLHDAPFDPVSARRVGYGGTETAAMLVAQASGSAVFYQKGRRSDAVVGSVRYTGQLPEEAAEVVVVLRDPIQLPRVRRLYPGARATLWVHDPIRYCDAAYRDAASGFDDVVAVSRRQAELWRLHGVPHARAVHNPMPPLPVRRPTDPHMLVSTSDKTDFRRLHRIFVALRNMDARFHMHVCVPHHFRDGDVPEGMVVHGNLPRGNVLRLLASALCVVYPTDFQESFGYVFAEPMALGVPVVTNDVPGSSASEMLRSPPPLRCDARDEEFCSTIVRWSRTGQPRIDAPPFLQPEEVSHLLLNGS